MLKMIGYLIFSIKYYVYTWFTSIFEPKEKVYFMFLFGQYPQNFEQSFKTILNYQSIFLASVNAGSIIIKFSSKKSLKEINEIFKKLYEDDVVYFLVKESSLAEHVNGKTHEELYGTNVHKLKPADVLSDTQRFIDTVNTLRDKFSRLMDEQSAAFTIFSKKTDYIDDFDFPKNEKITMGRDINPILEKIKKHGVESLTKEEQIILNNYSKSL